jgi:hypothetical protein
VGYRINTGNAIRLLVLVSFIAAFSFCRSRVFAQSGTTSERRVDKNGDGSRLQELDDLQATACEPLERIAVAVYDASATLQAHRDEYDVIIKNGSIVDGSGNPWMSGDIAIRGDRVAAIGRLNGADAKRVIDAKGLVISPGSRVL